MGPLSLTKVFISDHALDRYRIHHRGATLRDLGEALDSSEEVPAETARLLVGRASEREGGASGWYMLPPDRRGLFVIDLYREDSSLPYTCVTYLRFQYSQQRFARERWPLTGQGKPFFLEDVHPTPIARRHPDIDCLLEDIAVSPCLRVVFGGEGSAREELLDGDLLSVYHDPEVRVTTYCYRHRSGLCLALQRGPEGSVVAGLLDDRQNAIDELQTA